MATILDIARQAGVSTGAVSRILNNDATLKVSDETRAKVFAVAKELNYSKKPRSKINSKAVFTMGLLQWFSAIEELKDNYYLLARKGIEDFCNQHAIEIIRVFPGETDVYNRLAHVDGLICLGKFGKNEIQDFTGICKNIVFLDMPVEEYHITSLSMDFEHAVYDVLNYLTGLGHKKIGYLGGREYVGDKELFRDTRTSAFKKYMTHRHIEYRNYMKEGSFTSQSGYEMMHELLADADIPTAIFASNDAIAFGAMRAIQERGLRIPEDISIVGFNDEDTCAYMNPPLTTVHAPSYDMGQHGANLVYVASNLSITTPLKAIIPCELVLRGSCRKIL